MWVMLLMGFSSGLPLLMIGSTLQAWMKEEGVDLSVIGIFSLVGLPYTLKFLWAPAMDRYVPAFLGRRRGWALLSQLSLASALFLMSLSQPAKAPMMVALLALLVSFVSASQDIVLDAYRRESFSDAELGLASSFFINGYRLGMLLAGAGALLLADHFTWPRVYQFLSYTTLIGMITTLLAAEPKEILETPKTLREAVIEPFLDFFKRQEALLILAFIVLYKIGDTMAAAMATPFILDLGFTKTEFATIAKTLGMAATIGGGFLGGILMVKLGINRSLWVFGIFQMVAILAFSLLAQVGHNRNMLALAISLDYTAVGMGTAAYAAYMASLCNKKFSATQYALLSSVMGIPRVIAAAPTGYLAKHLGWGAFFFVCTLAAIPGLLLLPKLAPWNRQDLRQSP